ncbi:hypothetical protein [Fodinibius sediminis]|uniref:Uncharacterized protein n=1 Tax=Fodinibius sediminis TaxID=1214077 RepID=A0A521B6R7_9BACT|nr:hypothetical protein [Fodinibius sediminis]SMO42798.1 hypothetical protein SAMN06265218_102243 [Fodinibius sediminis]
MDTYKRIIAVVLLLNILLVATHEGEFWPFSIFPMFSQAGQPWSRGVVENVQDTTRADLWQTKPIEEISNRILPLEDYGIHEIDFANYISKTRNWDRPKINGLRSTFQIDEYPGEQWMPTRVVGAINDEGSVVIRAIPMFLFTADTTYKNPNLFSSQ